MGWIFSILCVIAVAVGGILGFSERSAQASSANTKSVFTAVRLDVYSPHDTPHRGGASCSGHAEGLRLVKTHLEGKLLICEWR